MDPPNLSLLSHPQRRKEAKWNSHYHKVVEISQSSISMKMGGDVDLVPLLMAFKSRDMEHSFSGMEVALPTMKKMSNPYHLANTSIPKSLNAHTFQGKQNQLMAGHYAVQSAQKIKCL